jgi:hypothetical protein
MMNPLILIEHPLLCHSQVLLLDSSIRDWVLFPILVVMILVGLVRHNITQLITSSPKMQPADVVRQQRILVRSTTLRNNRFLLSPAAFKSRLDWFTDVLTKGDYVKKEEEKKVSSNAAFVYLLRASLLNPILSILVIAWRR